MQPFQQLSNTWQRIMRILNILIDLSEIKADPALDLLLNNQNRSIERASRTDDRNHFQKFIKNLFSLCDNRLRGTHLTLSGSFSLKSTGFIAQPSTRWGTNNSAYLSRAFISPSQLQSTYRHQRCLQLHVSLVALRKRVWEWPLDRVPNTTLHYLGFQCQGWLNEPNH